MKGMTVNLCDHCEKESDELYVCVQCDEEICPDCAMMPDQFNRIEYTICESCQNERDRERAEDAERREMCEAFDAGRLYWVIHLYVEKEPVVTYQIRNRS